MKVKGREGMRLSAHTLWWRRLPAACQPVIATEPRLRHVHVSACALRAVESPTGYVVCGHVVVVVVDVEVTRRLFRLALNPNYVRSLALVTSPLVTSSPSTSFTTSVSTTGQSLIRCLGCCRYASSVSSCTGTAMFLALMDSIPLVGSRSTSATRLDLYRDVLNQEHQPCGLDAPIQTVVSALRNQLSRLMSWHP